MHYTTVRELYQVEMAVNAQVGKFDLKVKVLRATIPL